MIRPCLTHTFTFIMDSVLLEFGLFFLSLKSFKLMTVLYELMINSYLFFICLIMNGPFKGEAYFVKLCLFGSDFYVFVEKEL